MVARPDTFSASTAARSRRPAVRRPLTEAHPHVRTLVENSRLELVPMKSLEMATADLPACSVVSMTCSPAKSIEATLDATERLVDEGHHVTPHISARMVHSHDHLSELADRISALGLPEIFVVAGDADTHGAYFDAIEFLDDFLALEPAVQHIGFTAYPDTHPLIEPGRLHEALHRKQAMILGSGRTAHVSTQMCYSADRIRSWLRRERAAGLTVPVHLGVPGVVDRSKLMTMGMRLGVGSSLRYLSKNRSAIGRLMTQRNYRPDQVLRPLAPDARGLGIDALHLFTFNQVRQTEEWRSRFLDR